MASFTDSPSATRFTPYIQQVPVEALTRVGIEKQQRYDEGIQKIQSQIDSVAGMDVVRDIDKQYLQGQLDSLGTKLRTVAAGDFSSFQLVNSVGGMVGKIAKDPNVQNAVYSTMKYRKGLEDMNTSIKEGKSSPSNEWDFMNQADRWMKSRNINESFNGRYTPYTNYRKNALEVIKSLTKDETITDNAFTTDGKGNLVITDAIVRQKLSGISPEKIQQALVSGLSPSDFRQMEIDGRYTYSNMDDKSFRSYVNSSYRDKVDYYNQQKTILSNAKSSTTSAVEKNRLDQQIASLDNTIKNITSEYQGIAGAFSGGNTEAAKARLHTANFINGFSRGFSYTQTSQTVENNPYAQIQLQRDIKDQEWKKFKLQYEQSDRHFYDNLALDREKIRLSAEANLLKKKELEGYGGLPGTVNQNDVPKYSVQKVVSEIETKQTALEQADEEFIRQNGKDRAWFTQQETAYMKSPSGVDPKVAAHFSRTEDERRKIESDKIMLQQINEEAKKQYGDIYSKIPKEAKDINIQAPNGDIITYTPKDIVDFNRTFDKFRTISSTGPEGGGFIVQYNDQEAKASLSPREYLLYTAYKNNDQNKPLAPYEKAIVSSSKELFKTVNLPHQETLKKIEEFASQELQNRLILSQGAEYTIPTANTAQKTSIAGLLTSFANKAEKQNGKLENSPNFNVADAREIATDGKSNYNIKVVEGTEISPAMYEITATGTKGKMVQFKVTPEDKRAVFGSLFEPSAEVRAIRPYQEQIAKMGGYSTATSPGSSSVANSYLHNTDFPGINLYGVSGNIEKINGLYSIRLNFYDPVTKKLYEDIPFPPSGLVSEERLAEALRGVNDAVIYELINETPATSADLKKVKEASKKPQ